MSRVRARKAMRPLNDFQVFKGRTEETMKAFGGPVMAHHEARLLVSNDQKNALAGPDEIYAIYRRSEHRILQIVRPEEEAVTLPIAA